MQEHTGAFCLRSLGAEWECCLPCPAVSIPGCSSLAGTGLPSGGSPVPSGGFPARKEVHGITLRWHLHPGSLGQVLWERCCCLRHLFPENPSQVKLLEGCSNGNVTINEG